MKCAHALAALACLLLVVAAAHAAQEPAAGKVMIVIDASGSMWGQIQGETKIESARRAIRELLTDWDPRIELGLAAYGHRRKGDCTDIQVLVPVGRGTEKAVLRAVERLSPKGKTPLSDAVRMAAEALKFSEERATVILVSDGKETCDADPCALGEALEAGGVDFTAHVIGFDIEKGEEAGLRCLAEQTGGRYTAAGDPGGLKEALRTTVQVVQEKAAEPVAPPPRQREAGVALAAVYSRGGPEYKGDINWWVQRREGDAVQEIAKQHRGKSGQVFKNLPAGPITVVAELSDARYIRRTFEIEVAAGGAERHELVLDIGTVRLDALMAEGGKPFAGDLGWWVLERKKDLSGQRKEVAEFWRVKSGAVVVLPAGEWLLRTEPADARYISAEKEILVEPGGEEVHELILNAALVRLDARMSEGGEVFQDDLGWWVLEPKKDLSGKRKELTEFWRVKSGQVFVLPAGTWLLKAAAADARYVETSLEITLEPGAEEAHGVVLHAGRVRLDARPAPGSEPFEEDLGWWFLEPEADLSGKHKELTEFWRVKSGRVVLLPAGEWLVRSALADHRHAKTEGRLSLAPGEEKVLELVFGTGRVRVDVTLEGEPHTGQVGWNIFEGTGEKEITKAWRVNSGRVTHLPEGDYRIQALVPDDRSVQGAGTFSVAAGEDKAVVVDLKRP